MARLNFLADVLVSYSNAFKKFFHPVLEEITDGRSSTPKQFTIDGCLESFQRLLYKSADDKSRTDNFLLMLQEDREQSLPATEDLCSEEVTDEDFSTEVYDEREMGRWHQQLKLLLQKSGLMQEDKHVKGRETKGKQLLSVEETMEHC